MRQAAFAWKPPAPQREPTVGDGAGVSDVLPVASVSVPSVKFVNVLVMSADMSTSSSPSSSTWARSTWSVCASSGVSMTTSLSPVLFCGRLAVRTKFKVCRKLALRVNSVSVARIPEKACFFPVSSDANDAGWSDSEIDCRLGDLLPRCTTASSSSAPGSLPNEGVDILRPPARAAVGEESGGVGALTSLQTKVWLIADISRRSPWSM
mmetsp:Transcript_133493/g.386418  ORF Transcript_133493/g.386418 Transcript_133493/m.386418 type:complete len:208 (+) Transcript_133493:1307-1930(+)